MTRITRYFVARWLASLPTEGTLAGWLRGIANSLPGRTQSELGRRLFRAVDLLEGGA